MNRKAVITISDRHEVDGEFEEASLSTVGEFEPIDGGYRLIYDELEDYAGSVTALTYQDGGVTMIRQGEKNAELVIEKDKRYTCMYATEYVDLTLGVFGKEIKSELNENGGRLFFSYTLDFNTGFCSQNELTVDFRFE